MSWYLYRRLFQEGATNISIGEKPTNRSEISRAITVSVVIAFKILTFLTEPKFLVLWFERYVLQDFNFNSLLLCLCV